MPMKWDAAAESKLLTAIVRIYDVRLGGDKSERLAKLMGPECNAKAIADRMTSIRKRGLELNDEKGDDEDEPRVKKRKTKGAKAGGKRGKKAKEVEASDVEDDEKASPPTKRAKRDSKVNHNDGIEVGEDVGEGLRSVVKPEEDDDEDLV